MLRKKLSEKRGSGVTQMPYIILAILITITFFMRAAPILMAKQQLDTFAMELCREAQISGRVGKETNERAAQLKDATGLDPDIDWSVHGKIQLGEEIKVTLRSTKDLGFFTFGHIPIPISSVSEGRSEMYWKE